MNSVILIGRLVKDPELRYTGQEQKAVANFTLAVNREYAKDKADFLRVVVWGNQAESCNKYLKKGSQVAVKGAIQTGSYKDKDGKMVYTVDIRADRVEFLDSKPKEEAPQQRPQTDDFPEIDDDGIPF